jgi:hypothetical protein
MFYESFKILIVSELIVKQAYCLKANKIYKTLRNEFEKKLLKNPQTLCPGIQV